jgi:hypothetical protein
MRRCDMEATPPPILCADCGASPDIPIAIDDDVFVCPSCYQARLSQVELANAVSAAQEIIRWHHVWLDGYAVPPIGIGGRRI